MKVLALIGSPRKIGNSYKLTKRVEQLIKRHDDIDFEYVFLQDKELKKCIGCHNCIFIGEKNCPLNDDRDFIIEKMKKADGIIFVSPTYVLNVSALFKNFVDHLAYICHRPLFFDKHAMLLTTTAAIAYKDTLKLMKTPVTSWGFHVSSELGLVTPPGEKIEKIFDERQNKIEKASEKFYKDMKSGKPGSPSFFSLMQFYIFKKISFSKSEILKADYRFYQTKKNDDFYMDIKINPMKKVVAKFLSKIVFKLTF
jgi:multimeric flavodoxin WrbA